MSKSRRTLCESALFSTQKGEKQQQQQQQIDVEQNHTQAYIPNQGPVPDGREIMTKSATLLAGSPKISSSRDDTMLRMYRLYHICSNRVALNIHWLMDTSMIPLLARGSGVGIIRSFPKEQLL
mmetsp:Transcript_15794/g.24048  ORF Transcript_15794/g.24048 Transcript_15794/m.24048 type:complete len:123 (-) Transcript_15794:424-792(-)